MLLAGRHEKRIRWAAIVAACSLLSGCFFVFIPGSVVQSVSDSITGAEGDHCVTTTKVGDVLSLPSGGRGAVKSLSGTSVKCTDPKLPIRARIEPESFRSS